MPGLNLRTLSMLSVGAAVMAGALALRAPASGVLAGPYLQRPGQTEMTVMWIRSESGVCTVRYGVGNLDSEVQTDYSQTGAGASGTEYIYEARLTGLTGATSYNYQVDLGGSTVEGTFKTLAASPAESRFIFVSDSHGNASVLGGLAARFAAHNPAFILHGGDMTDAGNTYTNWGPGLFTPLGGVIDRIPFVPAHGNHEADGTVYHQLFAMPNNEYWYSFDHGDVHVVVLNSTLYRYGSLQPLIPQMLAWCQADLAASTAKWKVVVHHQPTFDLGWRGDTDQWGRNDFLPVYRAGGVDLILSGHAHVYARYKPIYKTEADRNHPITQIVGSGGGGGLSSALYATPHLAVQAQQYHYMAFTVNGDQLSGQAIKADGTVLDSFTITKTNGQYDAAWLAQAQPEDTFGRVIITAQPSSTTADVGATATFSVGAVGAQYLYYQWRKNGVDISGANGSSYTTPAAAAGDSGSRYSVVVSNYLNSVTSQDAALIVNGVPTAPMILAEPQDAMVNLGGAATFSVTAAGTAPLGYQWKRDGADISGATASSYTIPAVALSDDHARFSVVVTNAAGNVASREALLSLPPIIAVTPGSVAQSVPTGQSAGRQLTVTNSGNGRLDWSAALAVGFTPRDSKTAGGPSYAWSDISDTGTAIAAVAADEGVSGPLPLGFGFPFYGQSFTSVRVCSNGYRLRVGRPGPARRLGAGQPGGAVLGRSRPRGRGCGLLAADRREHVRGPVRGGALLRERADRHLPGHPQVGRHNHLPVQVPGPGEHGDGRSAGRDAHVRPAAGPQRGLSRGPHGRQAGALGQLAELRAAERLDRGGRRQQHGQPDLHRGNAASRDLSGDAALLVQRPGASDGGRAGDHDSHSSESAAGNQQLLPGKSVQHVRGDQSGLQR
jgi:hypothetical protein